MLVFGEYGQSMQSIPVEQEASDGSQLIVEQVV